MNVNNEKPIIIPDKDASIALVVHSTSGKLTIENKILAIQEKYNTAKNLLAARKTALNEKLGKLVADSQCDFEVFRTAKAFIDNDQDFELDYSIKKQAHDEYEEYIWALYSTNFLHSEKIALSCFKETINKLLKLVDTRNLSEKTKVAVRELIKYIDQHIEPGLWNTLFRKTSWNMLLNVLMKTISLIQAKKDMERTDPTALDTYTTYLNKVDGKPYTGAFIYPEVLLPIMPLIPGIIVFFKSGLEIGFLHGGVLCPALGLAICLALSLASLYFVVRRRLHTGLSKKMLNVADAERKFADNQLLENKKNTYNQKTTELMKKNPDNELINKVFQSIDDMYGSNDPDKSLLLLELVEKMLAAKTQPELNKVTKDLIQSSQTNTYSSFVVSLFKSETSQLKEDILSLAVKLQSSIQSQNDKLRRAVDALMSQ